MASGVMRASTTQRLARRAERDLGRHPQPEDKQDDRIERDFGCVFRRMLIAFADTSEIAVKVVGAAVTMPGNRGRDRGGEVAVRGNSNLRPGTLAPFCSGNRVSVTFPWVRPRDAQKILHC